MKFAILSQLVSRCYCLIKHTAVNCVTIWKSLPNVIIKSIWCYIELKTCVVYSEHKHYVTKFNLLFISSDLMWPSIGSFSILLSNFSYLDSPFAPSIFSWSFSFFRFSSSSFCLCLSSCLRRYLAAASSFSFRWSAHWSSCHSRRTLRHLKGKQRETIYQHLP